MGRIPIKKTGNYRKVNGLSAARYGVVDLYLSFLIPAIIL